MKIVFFICILLKILIVTSGKPILNFFNHIKNYFVEISAEEQCYKDGTRCPQTFTYKGKVYNGGCQGWLNSWCVMKGNPNSYVWCVSCPGI